MLTALKTTLLYFLLMNTENVPLSEPNYAHANNICPWEEGMGIN